MAGLGQDGGVLLRPRFHAYDQFDAYARDGVEIDRRLMAQQMGRVGFEREIMAAHVMGEILKRQRVFADETSLPTLAPGRRGEEGLALGLCARRQHLRRQRSTNGGLSL